MIAQVCLFNRITHQIDLAGKVDAVWRDIRTAHYFDTVKRRAERLKLAPGVHQRLAGRTEPVR